MTFDTARLIAIIFYHQTVEEALVMAAFTNYLHFSIERMKLIGAQEVDIHERKRKEHPEWPTH